LVAEKINDKQEEKRSCNHRSAKNIDYNKTDTIQWIEKLLQTPIADHRKYALWRIVIPYLFNVRKLEDSEIIGMVQVWLDKCAAARQLDFNSKYLVRQYIRNRIKNHYLPIGISKLSTENQDLFSIIS
jgi:Primase X